MIKDINFAAINLTGFENLSGLEDENCQVKTPDRGSGRATFQKFKTFGKFPTRKFATTIILAFLLPLLLGEGWGEVKAINSKLDSLWNLYNKATHDTTRIKLYLNIGDVYEHEKPDTAIFFYQKALNLAELNNKQRTTNNKQFLSLQATSLNYIGNIHYYKGDYDKAIDFYFKSLKIAEGILSEAKELSEKQNAKKEIANTYNNIGLIHHHKGEYDKAIDLYYKSLKIAEGILSEAKELSEKQNAQKRIAYSYNNIGIIHDHKGDYDKAIEFYFKSLKIREEIGDKKGMAASYNNIGIIHKNKGDYDKAIDFYFKSLKICEELGDKNGMSTSYGNIGSLYLRQGKAEEAKKQQLQALNIATEIGYKYLMYQSYKSLALCDSALGNFRGAYEYHKLYSQVHDSVFSKESSDKIAEMGAKYEAEKRELTIQKLEKEKLLQNETLARKEAESKKQRILLFSFLAGFIIILVFSVFLYRLFVQKKMANAILAQQKEEISAQRDEIETQRDLVTKQKEHIEEIHKEVTDSINYAKRIQEAILPVSVAARSVMGEHFVLFRPKDIVSGDFYWVAQISTMGNAPLLVVAVADCTGHGVPGAFMSMLGISFLNEIVNKQEIVKANEILNQLRKEIINALQQKGVQGEQKDGMDISLVVIRLQDSNSKFQEPSEEEREKVRQGESEQLADNDTELRSSEMFIEKESDTNPVATTNENQSGQVPCDNKQTSNIKHQTSNVFHAQWAGANNPLWLVRCSKNLTGFENLSGLGEENSQVKTSRLVGTGYDRGSVGLGDDASANDKLQTTNLKLFEFKPDKQPIAIHPEMKDFTNHEIQLSKGDTIYLASDGYEDQFGGEKGKKFLSKRLKEMLVANCEKSMCQQGELLADTIENWKNGCGCIYEQTDDITVMGIRI